ncbi:hypothetical protein ACFYOT_42640 [Saccharothrix saharensis]|uniref:hypothetical protein n=1 Tax=Saccharothrix saharensis TaxID=571190 RepID=UPI00368A3C8B
MADVLAKSDVDGLVELARHSEHRRLLGETVAAVEGSGMLDEVVLLLDAPDPVSEFAAAYVESLAGVAGEGCTAERFVTWSTTAHGRFLLALSMRFDLCLPITPSMQGETVRSLKGRGACGCGRGSTAPAADAA